VGDPQAAASARQALGEELAAYRVASGYTQARFAHLTGYSRSTVANVETGRQRVPRAFWERCDTALRTGGVLAGAHDDLDANIRSELRAAARRVSKERQARASPPPPEQDLGSAAHGEASGIPASASLPAAWPVSRETGPEQAESGAWGHGPGVTTLRHTTRRVTPGDLVRLRGMRAHLKSIDNSHGGGAALPMATWYLRHEVLPLLDQGRGGPLARPLLEVVAEAELDVGWAAYDAGQQPLATRYFTDALRLSHAARNRLLGGRILTAMSHQAIYLGNRRQAVDFAQAARGLTRQIATPRMVAMEAAMEACAHAAAGNPRACHTALRDAGEALALIADGQPDPDWLDFDEGGYWGHAARAHRDLGELRRAEECALKAVGMCLAPHSRTRAQRNTIQATAHLRLGEVEAAVAAGEQVIREAWNLHSRHVFGEIAELVAAIKTFATPTATDFLDQAQELLSAREPTLPGGQPATP
jgi:transcriptional regulator with XRE-family HTH domain